MYVNQLIKNDSFLIKIFLNQALEYISTALASHSCTVKYISTKK